MKFSSVFAATPLAVGCFSPAMASNGPIDGIYSCAVGSETTFVALNGYPDGRTIYTIIAISPATSFYGFGLGQVSGNTFSGNTSFNLPFNFTITNGGTGFRGTVGVVVGTTAITASAICSKIW